MTDNFWYNNISILYDKNYILEIIPNRDYDLNRKLNALVRLSIIYGIVSYLFTNNSEYMCIPFITLIATLFLYKYTANKEGFSLDFKNIYEKIPSVDVYDEDSCILPTKDNPFMNLNTYDYSRTDNVVRNKACKSYDNVKIQNMIESKFNQDLFLDSNDLFNRRNSQRQFYTMPNTSVPNNQDEFARSLYDIGDRERSKFLI